MPLPASGNPISLGQVNAELGIASATLISLNDAAVRSLFVKSSGAIAMSDGHGKSNAPTLPPTLWSSADGYYQAGQTITAYFNNPNNTGLAYTVTWYGSNNDCWGVNWGNGYYQKPQGALATTYSGTLAGGGVSAISGPTAYNGHFSQYYSWPYTNSEQNGTLGRAGRYAYSIYFSSLGLTLTSPSLGSSSSGWDYVYIRGEDYQHTVYYNDECCRNGGCESGCNGYAIEVTSDQSENCCCYDCNGDGITACGDPNDPNYDSSNPPCRAECNPGDIGSACGWTTNYYYNCGQGSVVNCPYSQQETTYDVLYGPQC